MKRILSLITLLGFFSASKSQLIYNMGDSSQYTFRATSFAQTSSVTASQSVLFDDVNLRNTTLVGKDSIKITRITTAIVRYANAPATTLNLWYTPVQDTATTLPNVIKLPPVLVSSISLPAQGTTSGAFTVNFGDSIATLLRIKVDSNKYVNGYQTFFLGLSYSDTTGNAVYIGGSTNNVTFNDDVFWFYRPLATPKLTATYFGGNPKAKFYFKVYGQTTVLPVTLSSFTGIVKENNGILSWTTESELNNKGFDIEKSIEGKNFVKIGSKEGKANSTVKNEYSFVDEKLAGGTSYYRLKQIDNDGAFKYSQVITLNNKKFDWQLYPNPIVNNGFIKLNLVSAANVNIQLVSVDGKLVQSINKGLLSSGNYNIPFTVEKKGTYVLKLVIDGETFSKVIVK